MRLDLAGRAVDVQGDPDTVAEAFRSCRHLTLECAISDSTDRAAAAATLKLTSLDSPLDDRTPGIYVDDAGAFGVHHAAGAALELLHADGSHEFVVTPPAWADGYIRAQPMLTSWCTWLASTGVAVMHAAAVEIDGRGVLLLGDSGAGKSTLSVAAAVRGAGYLGDDVVALSNRDGVIAVHSLYASAKLNADSDRRSGAETLEHIADTDDGKRVRLSRGPVRPAGRRGGRRPSRVGG
jgi:hypothetical protein